MCVLNESLWPAFFWHPKRFCTSERANFISMDACGKPWIIPIPGTRKLSRLKEDMDSTDIELRADEVSSIRLGN